jgi:hypothetical protein
MLARDLMSLPGQKPQNSSVSADRKCCGGGPSTELNRRPAACEESISAHTQNSSSAVNSLPEIVAMD